MYKILKIGLACVSMILFSQNSNAFDLKSLTNKLQKDLGGKLNIPKSIPSSKISSGGSSKPNANKTKLAKQMCEPNIPQIIKNLPEGNIADLENDFGKKSEGIKKILVNIPNTDDDQYVSS